MKRMVLIVVLFATLCAGASADDQFDNELLGQIDDNLNQFKNMHFTLKLMVITPQGDEKYREIKTWQQGEMRMSKFVKPASDRGMAALSTDEVNSFIYFPATKKVRRIAAHVRNQTFLGTELSYEDMATTRYLDDYNGKKTGEDEQYIYMVLTPNAGSKASYSKVEIQVNKERMLIDVLKYYDGNGELLKTESRENWKFFQDTYWNLSRIVVTNEKTGGKTIMDLEEIVFDLDLPEDTFTQRNLKRPIQ